MLVKKEMSQKKRAKLTQVYLDEVTTLLNKVAELEYVTPDSETDAKRDLRATMMKLDAARSDLRCITYFC